MKYKLLAIDMDGTFLKDDRSISEQNINAVKRIASKGVKVVVCSGRVPFLLRPILREMPDKQPFIALNGGIIFDHNNKVIYSSEIGENTVFEVIDILRKDFDGVYYHFFHGDIACSERFESIIRRYYERNLLLPRENRMDFRILADSKKYIKTNKCEIRKMEIYDDGGAILSKIKDKLRVLPGIEIVDSGKFGLEITKKSVNKGNALEILAKHYGYAIDECIAIGNDGNDLEMIKKAGLGIAVSNAKDYIRRAANYITERDNNNDAVAEVINKFIDIPI